MRETTTLARALGLAAALALLLAPPAGALSAAVYPADNQDAVTEEHPLELQVQTDEQAGHVVVAVRPASAGPCADRPEGDPGQARFDAAMEAAASATAGMTLPDAGDYAVCGWQTDGAGAIVARLSQALAVDQERANLSIGLGATATYRGVPFEATVQAEAAAGRVVQTAMVAGDACPASAPATARWVGPAAGVPAARADEERFVTLEAAGPWRLCSWVGEFAGDPQPEAARSEELVIRAGRVTPLLTLRATRARSRPATLQFGLGLAGASTGTLVVEVQARPRGRWRRVARYDVARLRVYRGPPVDTPIGSSEFAQISGRAQVPRSIATQCARHEPRLYRARARFLGSAFARPRTSRVATLAGNLGCG